MAPPNKTWHELGALRPTDLNEERLQLHWAAQPLGALADAGIERRSDDSHTNLGWDHDDDAFVTQAFPGNYAAALGVTGFRLQWRQPDGTALARFALKGNTLDAALAWLSDQIQTTIGNLPDGPVPLRDYEMPGHAVAGGQAFDGGDRERRVELAHWFANADIALGETAKENENSSEVRNWPHHFDTGLLINLDPDKDPEEARSIGVGMSPGDGPTPQPYYYVNPYPRPQGADLPTLPVGGRWEREAFFGAILTGEALIDGGEPGEQQERVREFLALSIAACRDLLAVG